MKLTAEMVLDARNLLCPTLQDRKVDDPIYFMCHAVNKAVYPEFSKHVQNTDVVIDFNRILVAHRVGNNGRLMHNHKSYSKDYANASEEFEASQNLRFDFMTLIAYAGVDFE